MSDKPSGDTNAATRGQFTSLFHVFMNPAHPDLFLFTNPEYLESVVRSALEWREQAGNEARQAFETAIRDTIVRLDGFRPQNIHRAPSASLQEPALGAALRSDEFAGAMLRVWAEAHSALHDAMVKHLDGQDIPTPGPDFSEHGFRGFWDFDSWQKERGRIVQLHKDLYDEDDLALMLCYVSGKMPTPPENRVEEASTSSANKDLFEPFLEYLRLLPPNAPEWERGIPEFVTQVGDIIESKEAERHQVAALEAIITEVGHEFSEELNYLELGIDSWPAALCLDLSATPQALELVAELKDSLEEYRPIREQAPVRSEELIRAEERTKLESGILSTVDNIHRLMSGGQDPGDAAPQPQPEAVENAEENTPSDQPQGRGAPSNGEAATGEHTQAHIQGFPAGTAGADSSTKAGELSDPGIQPAEAQVAIAPAFTEEEYNSLQLENQEIRQDVGLLKEEVETLRSDLHDSRTLEEYWRSFYQKAQQGPEDDGKIEHPTFEDVNTAVNRARQKFSPQLLFRLNSESEVEDNPFNTPQTVWEALRWLATTYYQSRTGELRVTDFDQSIREACGWWYKSDQQDSTMRRYPNSYSIQVNGRRYWLAEHVGKGTSWDARYTIRIGFNWDKELRKVVVGFIGRHQQTDAS